MPIPQRIQDAPSLRLGLDIFLTAFFDLSSSRQVGMAAGNIPWGVVQYYCDTSELDKDQAEDMHFHIGHMDAAWLDWNKSKQGGSHG